MIHPPGGWIIILYSVLFRSGSATVLGVVHSIGVVPQMDLFDVGNQRPQAKQQNAKYVPKQIADSGQAGSLACAAHVVRKQTYHANIPVERVNPQCQRSEDDIED